ncbi:MAG: peptide deformylase [Candidatus Paceibacterota bacterium]|jgi:peptide deformylase
MEGTETKQQEVSDQKEFTVELPAKTDKEEKVDYTKFYVKPHKKVSEPVTEKNLDRLLKDAVTMLRMCGTPHGRFPSAFAIAHAQMDDKEPLRFFVTFEGELIINPVIVRHTRHTIVSDEGCMTYPFGPLMSVPRWNKCEVEYQTLDDDDKLTEIKKKNLSGKDSKVWQHEIDHMDGIYIYDRIEQSK